MLIRNMFQGNQSYTIDSGSMHIISNYEKPIKHAYQSLNAHLRRSPALEEKVETFHTLFKAISFAPANFQIVLKNKKNCCLKFKRAGQQFSKNKYHELLKAAKEHPDLMKALNKTVIEAEDGINDLFPDIHLLGIELKSELAKFYKHKPMAILNGALTKVSTRKKKAKAIKKFLDPALEKLSKLDTTGIQEVCDAIKKAKAIACPPTAAFVEILDKVLKGESEEQVKASDKPENSGNAGNSGKSGDLGDSGSSGKSGDSGNSGNSGDSGDSGNPGDSRDSGNAQNSGNSGNSKNLGNEGNDEEEEKENKPEKIEKPKSQETVAKTEKSGDEEKGSKEGSTTEAPEDTQEDAQELEARAKEAVANLQGRKGMQTQPTKTDVTQPPEASKTSQPEAAENLTEKTQELESKAIDAIKNLSDLVRSLSQLHQPNAAQAAQPNQTDTAQSVQPDQPAQPETTQSPPPENAQPETTQSPQNDTIQPEESEPAETEANQPEASKPSQNDTTQPAHTEPAQSAQQSVPLAQPSAAQIPQSTVNDIKERAKDLAGRAIDLISSISGLLNGQIPTTQVTAPGEKTV